MDNVLVKILLGIAGISLGIALSKRMGYGKNTTFIKILIIILLIIFALWNERVFG